MIQGIDLDKVERVTFYKRDELTTDLICCRVDCGRQSLHFHEEMPEWSDLLLRLGELQAFKSDWFTSVSQPAFAVCETVAYVRS